MSKTGIHIDQLSRKVEIPHNPKRIISLVPSQTELLFELELDDRVVGITKFCVHPECWFRNKTRVGGTKKLNFEAISQLQPDLIIANKEENNQEDIERLDKTFPVWVSDVDDLDSAFEMISLVGKISQSDPTKLLTEIRTQFSNLKPIHPTKKTLYLIWKSPYMATGSDTFIHNMLKRCGLRNVISEKRYPTLTEDQIIQFQPELILLSSEPFPFKDNHVQELKSLVPNAEIKLVDGEMFSWYGSRLKLTPKYFQELLT